MSRVLLASLLFALVISAQCANVFQVDCESGPFDVAEEGQHVHCTVDVHTDFDIGQIFGYAVTPLNEPTNPNPNYLPPVEGCSHTYSTPTNTVTLDCEVDLPRFAADGEYTFNVYVIAADFSAFLTNTSTFEVEEEKNDRVPPTLVSLVAPTYYNAFSPTSDWVILHITDDASGVAQIYYNIHSTPAGGVELYSGHWAFEAEEEHNHEEEEEEEEGSEHEHEHGEGEESAPTDLHVTLPLTLKDHADEFTPGVFYLTVHIWDAFWDVRYTTFKLQSNGFKYNVTLLPPSNCVGGRYGPRTDRPNKCYSCPTSTYSLDGATKCGACPAGSIPNSLKNECIECPQGTYEDEGRRCLSCPSHQSGPLASHSKYQCEKI